jgi:hypothetical protein
VEIAELETDDWAGALAVLDETFCDKELNRRLLRKFEGDVDGVVEALHGQVLAKLTQARREGLVQPLSKRKVSSHTTRPS